MDCDTILHEPLRELFNILIEVLDHIRADGVGALTPRLPIGQRDQRGSADF